MTSTLLTAAIVLLSATSSPFVHGEGVLRADRGTAASGESLELDGREFEPDEEYQLKLVGTLQEFVLASVKTDAKGTFALTVALPRDAKGGSYKLQAVASDGDVSATLDVTLLATAPVPNARSAEPMGAMSDMPGPMARADEIPIARSQGGVVWALIGGLIGLAAGLGIGLLSRRKLEYSGS